MQVITNNGRVFRRVAEAFADLAQSLVPGHTFALRADAGGAHKVMPHQPGVSIGRWSRPLILQTSVSGPHSLVG